MKIHETRPAAIHPPQAPQAPLNSPPSVGSGGADRGRAPTDGRRRRSDAVELSPAAQARVASPTDPASPTLAPERIAEIRHRIQSGAYDSLEVVDEVARRILDRGDV